jgi:hypothetical protein
VTYVMIVPKIDRCIKEPRLHRMMFGFVLNVNTCQTAELAILPLFVGAKRARAQRARRRAARRAAAAAAGAELEPPPDVKTMRASLCS